jgi:hypothetical protein
MRPAGIFITMLLPLLQWQWLLAVSFSTLYRRFI